jgi:hypothetical protein
MNGVNMNGMNRNAGRAIDWLLIAGLLTVPVSLAHADEATGSRSASAKAAVPAVAESGDVPSPPAWLEETPILEGDVHRWPVRSQPASTPEMSRQLLQVQSRAAVETYLEQLLDSPDAAASLRPDDAWIADHLAPDRVWHGEVRRGEEVLYESAGVLLFDEQDRVWLREQWRAHLVDGRLKRIALLAIPTVLLAIVLLSVASQWAYRGEQRRATV